MAREFAGSTNTNRIDLSFSNTTQRSLSVWMWIDAYDTTARRLYDHAGRGNVIIANDGGVDRVIHQCNFSGGNGEWKITGPAAGAWRHLAITHDASDPANDAVFYLDGVAQSLTVDTNSSGTLTTGSATKSIGNRGGADRSFDGKIAEFAWFNRIITQDEITGLANRYSPLFYNSGLVYYARIGGINSPERDEIGGILGTVTGTTFFEHPAIIYPGGGANLLLMQAG